MKRILVVQDDALRTTLSERFEAGGQVQVSGARTPGAALLQALLERPGLIVCSPRSLELSPDAFQGRLARLGLGTTPLLCVHEDAATGPAQTAGEPAHCTAQGLFDAVGALLPLSRTGPRRRRVQLLASMDRMDRDDTAKVHGLANVIELAEKELVIEAPLPLEVGQRLALSFFLPREAAGPGQPLGPSLRITLTCAIRHVIDELRLHYEADIQHGDERSQEALAAFVSAEAGAREG